MSGWDELTEEQKTRIAAHNRRHHSAVNREAALLRRDAREQAMNEACDWLAANGFADASAALERVAFEVAA